jgi:peroxiredoxin
MTELRGLQLSLSEFRDRGVEVVAVSPDPVERNLGVVERLGLEFPVLSDEGLALTRAMGLEHPGGGPGGATVPRPATFIVRGGVVRWRDLTDNWRVRPRPDTILAALSDLGVPAP